MQCVLGLSGDKASKNGVVLNIRTRRDIQKHGQWNENSRLNKWFCFGFRKVCQGQYTPGEGRMV